MTQAYQDSHGGEAKYELGRQIEGGMGTGLAIFGLLASDVYEQVKSEGVDADDAPEIAYDLINSKGFLATCLFLAKGSHLYSLDQIIKSNIESPNGSIFTGVLATGRSPIAVHAEEDGGFVCRPNREVITDYWTSPEGQWKTAALGCPARKPVTGDDGTTTVMEKTMAGLAKLLRDTWAFEEYEDYLADK